ncbi:Golgi to ER traffic protein 4 [Golovinomyces cichoracearum]|uniref:Golgi to ER traffic protein 4 n=1 Tax=Golovinomyces cichoracearum TaxID=62708 RepID=A0A420IJA0_9PEZI|nr:Golgi to ER traffic protein 4 [Golovinomyces cichoracearum]
MSAKIQKIVVRLQQTIKDGQPYEAQQQTRVAASRHVKSKNWDSAIEILFNVAESLLKAGQGGSGGDLSLMLVDVYNKAELKPDPNNKGRLLTLLRLFDSDEPTRKKVLTLHSWSAKYGQYPAGEPDLHHVTGSIYAEEREIYEAERHLTLGTKDSPEILANLEYEWYNQDDSHTAPIYAARVVFPYLLAGNVRDANKSLQIFLDKLTTMNKTIIVQNITSSTTNVRIFPSLPLLNFLSLLLVAVQKDNPNSFKQLISRYSTHIKEVLVWDDALALVGEIYFGISRPRQGNPLLDIMGSIFSGAPSAKPKTKRIGTVEVGNQIETPVADPLD